jgi:ribosomal protein S18 acetylase RimI-like enzyme
VCTWDETAQRRWFYEKTDPTTHDLIEVDGTPVGCQWVRRWPDALELVRLWILPEAQGRGVGTLLVRRLKKEAGEAGVRVRLKVMKVNPAHRLYRRLGFEVTGETNTHLLMEAHGAKTPGD